MKRKKNKTLSLIYLVFAYLLSTCFVLLILLYRPPVEEIKTTTVLENNNTYPQTKVVHHHSSLSSVEALEWPSVIDDTREVVLARDMRELLPQTLHTDIRHNERVEQKLHNEKNIYGDYPSIDISERNNVAVRSPNNRLRSVTEGDARSIAKPEVDFGLLERRLKEREVLDLSSLNIVSENDSELGDLDSNFAKNGEGYSTRKGGQLYAYNFPTKGVGAGIGSSSVGAGAGGGAGLSAAIGEGLLNGEVVPTLGGVGDGSKNNYGQPSAPAGVGGLVGGAGAGGAAGLTQGYIAPKLGLDANSGAGGGETLGRMSYEHLPKNGSLHIMMHVDGSGSIINTRKQLERMKDTLLKEALLPYYNNSEDIYNRRVTIVDGSGERTLRFFTEASKKDNVLAVVFQDEAQPAYHLPNFNKKPEENYLSDLRLLESNLGKHKGIYRGIMFQVDRGKTFARSFKEFVGHAFHGTGYLSDASLKKYHLEHNIRNIKNKKGIVFNEEYHAQDDGDPKYYLNLLFEASKKLGLDLNIYGAGLKDGVHID